MRLSETQLESLFEDFTHSAFRLETRAEYAVGSEEERLRRYRAGEPLHIDAATREWLEYMRAEVAAGKRWHKVHVLTSPLSEYLRFECEWGYAVSTQYGQQVAILDTSEIAKPTEVIDEDFWLLDDTTVVLLRYDPAGRFEYAELAAEAELARYRAARDAALAAAVPFATYWAAHPQYARQRWQRA